jgi:hypothetical protein
LNGSCEFEVPDELPLTGAGGCWLIGYFHFTGPCVILMPDQDGPEGPGCGPGCTTGAHGCGPGCCGSGIGLGCEIEGPGCGSGDTGGFP